MRLFIDTSGFLASSYKSDKNYKAASKFMLSLKSKNIVLYTSDYVLDETLTIIRYRIGHSQAVKFAEWIKESRKITALKINEQVWNGALEIFRKYNDQMFSFTDCTSFYLMKKEKIENAFTFDKDFLITGFKQLP